MRATLHWFLHPSIRDRDEMRRALLVVAASGIAAAIALVIAAMQAAWGIWQSAAVCSVTALAMCGPPLIVRSSGRWRLAAVSLSGVIWIAAFSVAALTGGVLVSSLYYLIFASALAGATLGVRHAVGFALATIAVAAACYGARSAGIAPPIAIDPEIAISSAMRGAVVFVLAMAALVAAYETLRNATQRDGADSERRYRAIADYGPDLIAELDGQGRILYSTGRAEGLPADRIGVAAFRRIHRDDRAALVAAVAQLAGQSSVRVGPLRWLASRGAVMWFEASLTRVVVDGQTRTLVVARDVTQRVELEEQLRHSQKMQAVGQLASGMAHDVNNSLMVISGYAEALAERARGEPAAEAAVAEILRATDQSAAITRRLVSLARPAQGARASIDVNAIVRDNERMLRTLVGESCSLLLELSPSTAPIRANPGELEQVLVNLAANARDAMRAGGTLRIATVARGERVTLVVHDNGAGIDPATRERIFEPFFTTKPPGFGAGLGLFVVYSVVTSLGGEIHVTSEPGAGTRFTLDFPLAARAVSIVPSPQESLGNGRGERILVAEDRPDVRAIVNATLVEAGYSVTLAADGIEALALGGAGAIDLVVSDVVMPSMNGIELVKALREKRPALRAVLLSGHPGELAELPSRTELLRKPFRAAELLAAVRDQLGGR